MFHQNEMQICSVRLLILLGFLFSKQEGKPKTIFKKNVLKTCVYSTYQSLCMVELWWTQQWVAYKDDWGAKAQLACLTLWVGPNVTNAHPKGYLFFLRIIEAPSVQQHPSTMVFDSLLILYHHSIWKSSYHVTPFN